MKRFLWMILLSAISTQAQELPAKPEVTAGKLRVSDLRNAPRLARGEVWAPVRFNHKDLWEAREVNSCEWCARPMTFRQAAFDHKALIMWGSALALTVASTEVTLSRPCIRNHTCREANPMFGNSRAQQYGVRLPIVFSSWMATAYLRKGNRDLQVGGMKHWWLLPVAFQAMGSVSITVDASRRSRL